MSRSLKSIRMSMCAWFDGSQNRLNIYRSDNAIGPWLQDLRLQCGSQSLIYRRDNSRYFIVTGHTKVLWLHGWNGFGSQQKTVKPQF